MRYDCVIRIKEIANSIFTSKTYILYKEGCGSAWLVDIGDVEPVLAFLKEKGLTVAGVIITHGHFDHIYGLPSLVERFPACKVYTSEYGKTSLASDKLNMSRYHESSMTYEGDNVVVVHEGDEVRLFEDEPSMVFYETPGHAPGCLAFYTEEYIFTGDAYIPGVKVLSKLPGGNKTVAAESVEKILRLAEGKTICPGHGDMIDI